MEPMPMAQPLDPLRLAHRLWQHGIIKQQPSHCALRVIEVLWQLLQHPELHDSDCDIGTAHGMSHATVSNWRHKLKRLRALLEPQQIQPPKASFAPLLSVPFVFALPVTRPADAQGAARTESIAARGGCSAHPAGHGTRQAADRAICHCS